MKLQSDMTVNGKKLKKGTAIPRVIYFFFMIHMLIFGCSGFFMAYAENGPPILFLYMHGGIAILVYCVFYLGIFGMEQVKWMFINATLGIFGIYTEIDWLLGIFDKHVDDFPFYVHVIPFLYYVLYTFLLRQAILDLFNARGDETREPWINFFYVMVLLIVYGVIFFIA
jgi:hypothetical protein